MCQTSWITVFIVQLKQGGNKIVHQPQTKSNTNLFYTHRLGEGK